MTNYDSYIKEESVSYLKRMEKALDIATIINYNENMIEFPDLFILSKDNKVSLISKLLNPGIELFEIDDSGFEEILELISEKKEGIMHLEKAIVSSSTGSRLNVAILKENNLYVRDLKISLVVDDILFTTSEVEFHGTGLFTARKHVYLVSESVLSDLKKYFIQD